MILKPCPFCGGEPEVERIGTPRQSCIIACTDCGCRLETNETGDRCGYHWNDRVSSADVERNECIDDCRIELAKSNAWIQTRSIASLPMSARAMRVTKSWRRSPTSMRIIAP